jgi:uncharacterized Zn ribbon protein
MTEGKRNGNLYLRICDKPDGCGRKFMGGPRAWYCPECRKERQREQNRLHKARARRGETRPLGSTDICPICFRGYVVAGPNQQYCPNCAPAIVQEKDAFQGLAYYTANKDQINPARNERLRALRAEALTPCAECGQGFVKRGSAVVCQSCRPAWRKKQQAIMDARRRPKRPNEEKKG